MEKNKEMKTVERGRRNEVTAEVTSDKMDKTVTVIVYRTIKHRKYGKYLRRSTVLKVHDEKNVAKLGDKVRIYETRPLSKSKRWMLSEIIETAKN